MKDYQDKVLSNYEINSFTVRKELSAHPAVPEFSYNGAECKQFVEEIGTINKTEDQLYQMMAQGISQNNNQQTNNRLVHGGFKENPLERADS